jgi:hypothetical protein
MGRYHLKYKTKSYLENTGEAITTRNNVRGKTISEYSSLDLIPDPFVIIQPDRTIKDIRNFVGLEKASGRNKVVCFRETYEKNIRQA